VGLPEGLGRRVPAGASEVLYWKALDEAVRLCRWQRHRVILAIDDCQHLTDSRRPPRPGSTVSTSTRIPTRGLRSCSCSGPT